MKNLKKTHPRFNVPNYGSKGMKHVKSRWRKARGVDSKKREKRKFAGAEPTIGYKNPDIVANTRNGKRNIIVHNVDELKRVLSMPDRDSYDVTIARSVGKKKRMGIISAAGSSTRIRNVRV